jgi:hypothetical protein
LHQTAPNGTKLRQTAPNCTKLHQTAPNCTKLHQTALEFLLGPHSKIKNRNSKIRSRPEIGWYFGMRKTEYHENDSIQSGV